MSGTTEALVLDGLPSDAWLTDLGTHRLRDLPRPERVVQLCHPDLVNDFAPLRVSKPPVSQHLPTQLTNFVGRQAELSQVRELLSESRLVTLTGAGGVGKTRLAIQMAGQLAREFNGGVWYVDRRRLPTPSWCRPQQPAHSGYPTSPGAQRWTP